jgi:hypothetical protein
MTLRSILSAWGQRRRSNSEVSASTSASSGLPPAWASQVEPSGASDVPPYAQAFAACAAISEALGAAPMRLTPASPPLEKLHRQISRAAIAAGVRNRHHAGMAGQCLKWSHFLAPAIERKTGLRAWPTLGQLWKDDTRQFGMTWSELQAMVERGAHPAELAARGAKGLDLHAWITLSSGQIIDLTFASTLARVHPKAWGARDGVIACGQEDGLFDMRRYFPMLAGGHVFDALQAKSSLPFLASDVDELASTTHIPVLSFTR